MSSVKENVKIKELEELHMLIVNPKWYPGGLKKLLMHTPKSKKALMLNYKVYINGEFNYSMSALTRAIKSYDEDDPDDIKLLIDDGADVNEKYHKKIRLRGGDGSTAETPLELFIYRARNHLDMNDTTKTDLSVVKYFILHRADITLGVLKAAEKYDNSTSSRKNKMLPYLVEELKKRERIFYNSWKNLRSMEDTDVHEENEYGDTVLIIASSEGDIRNVNLLLGMGADINHRNKKGQTALHNAAYNKHSDVVNFLKEKGADTSIVDDTGMTYHDLL